nr:immunoglobulin light chain junction region [Macaca mulatta]
CQQENSIPRTF